MAINVIVDRLEGGSVKKTKDGWDIVRACSVSGLDDTNDADARLIEAVTEVIAVVGDIYAAHPTITAALITDFVPRALSTTSVEVRVQYKTVVYPVDEAVATSIEVGSSLSQVESNMDVNDNLISLEYTYPDDYEDEGLAGTTQTQGGTVSRQVAETTLVFSRRESVSPGTKSRTYTGATNASGWDVDPGAGAGTWMCSGILGRSDDNGVSYDVTYNFQYRADLWKGTAFFIDPRTGKPPPDLVEGTGYKVIDQYSELDFDVLAVV